MAKPAAPDRWDRGQQATAQGTAAWSRLKWMRPWRTDSLTLVDFESQGL